MKKLSLLFALLICGMMSVKAQETTVSPEKKKIIEEIISVTKADERIEKTMSAMFQQMQAVYPAMVSGMLEKQTNLTADQKKKIADELAKRTEFSAKFNERLMQRINFKDYGEQASLALYDKFFTANELKDLLEFYKTSTGQKLNEVLPEMSAESIRIAQQLLLPKITTIIDDLINEDIRNAQKSVSEPPKKVN